MTLPDSHIQALRAAGLEPDRVEALVRAAVEEDLDGGEDVTGNATVDAGHLVGGHVVARAAGVVAGIPVAAAVFAIVGGAELTTRALVEDGATVAAGDAVLEVTGPARSLLLAERTALNLLCRLSGIATVTRAWVDAVAGTGAAIRDTRKTTPLLRALEKYAVRCGGGVNHRMSLADAALVKDNHVEAAGGVVAAFEAVRRYAPDVPVEVEVDSLADARAAAEAGADLILLDNFDVATVRAAVADLGGRARLEVSGGLQLADARAYAETGVDYLAVGALTHSAPILDLGLDFSAGAAGPTSTLH